MKEVRCPLCDKKVADYLEGRLIWECPRCHEVVVLDKRVDDRIKSLTK
jgi:phage FluMu protein Com